MTSYAQNGAEQSREASAYSELTAAETEMFYSSVLAKSENMC